jgi:hypothetical protein
MNDERRIEVFGRKCPGLIEILFQNVPGGAEENHAKHSI